MLKRILAILAALFTTLALAAVDVNKGTEAELDSVKGIGPGTSKLIVTERKKGEFKNWDDFIQRVKGVGEKRAANLSEAGLTVNGSHYKMSPAALKTERKDEKKDAKADTKSDKKDAKAGTDTKKAKAEPKADKMGAQADARAGKEAKAEAKK